METIETILYSELPLATVLQSDDQFFVIQNGNFHRVDKSLLTEQSNNTSNLGAYLQRILH